MQADSIFAQRYEDGMNKNDYWDAMYEDSMNLIARLPKIAAYIYRRTFHNSHHIASSPDMDWGGIIASAMGGGAQAAGGVADDIMARRAREEADARTEQRQIVGERRRSMLNREEADAAADRKLKAEQGVAERYSKEADAAQSRALLNREASSLDALKRAQTGAWQVPQSNTKTGKPIEASPAASEAELAAMMADPNNRKIYEDAGYIPKTTGSGLIADQIAAARELGANPVLRADLKNDYTKQIDVERTAVKDDNAKRGLDQKDALIDNASRVSADRERRTEALFARIATQGQGRGDKGDTDQWLKLIGEQRKGYKDDLAQLRSDRKAAIDAEPNPTKKQALLGRFDAEIQSLKVKSEAIDVKVEAVTSRLLDKPGAPELKPKADKDSKPAKAQSAPDASGFVTGKTYQDAKGNTATYLGGGRWSK